MIEGTLVPLTVAAAVGCGLMAGIFYAFSTFVMSAFRRLAPDEGMRAMQEINLTAVMPPLMIALFGTALLCVAAGVIAILDGTSPSSAYVLVGAVVYVLGVVAVTAAYHVPRNNRLAELDSGTAAGRDYWARYLTEWTRMNHVRTVAPGVSATLFVVALVVS